MRPTIRAGALVLEEEPWNFDDQTCDIDPPEYPKAGRPVALQATCRVREAGMEQEGACSSPEQQQPDRRHKSRIRKDVHQVSQDHADPPGDQKQADSAHPPDPNPQAGSQQSDEFRGQKDPNTCGLHVRASQMTDEVYGEQQVTAKGDGPPDRRRLAQACHEPVHGLLTRAAKASPLKVFLGMKPRAGVSSRAAPRSAALRLEVSTTAAAS